MESRAFRFSRGGGRKAATPVCVKGGRVVRRKKRWEVRGGSTGDSYLPSRFTSSPVRGTSLCLGHKRDPQLPVVALTKRTFVKRVSFNFACKKIILHIFCTSLTVPIEPGPCGFAEGSRHNLDPAPPQRGKRKQQEAAGAGARRKSGVAAAATHPPPSLPGHPLASGSPSLQGPDCWTGPPSSTSSWPACGQGSRLLAKKGQPALDKARWCWVLLSALLFCCLTFFLTACCNLYFFWFGFFFCLFVCFSFIFPGGGEEEECLRRSVATHLTVFTLANANEVRYDHII
ncbi:hypothetical protein HJG60_010201 [Phyllostomus discolor]|uniref:Uncharacterized protein n=1 Tax=Phyllostomus discolor TaxID=89673 RepID=A0A834B297_9CHIR|nr:hypothetical protein HJG60_010201 [Phyllostomus discolor]